jgi:hypothetical protein
MYSFCARSKSPRACSTSMNVEAPDLVALLGEDERLAGDLRVRCCSSAAAGRDERAVRAVTSAERRSSCSRRRYSGVALGGRRRLDLLLALEAVEHRQRHERLQAVRGCA